MYLSLALFSGILQGAYYIFQKKSLLNNNVIKVLAAYTAINFLLTSFEFNSAMTLKSHQILIVFIKAVVIYFGWTLSFKAIKELPISISSPFMVIGPVFTTLLGQLILHERFMAIQAAAIVFIFIAYYFICKIGTFEINGLFTNKYIYFMVISMFFGSISALIDKVALKEISVGQMQFWFNLFMAVLYGISVLALTIKKSEIIQKKLNFNYFIPLMSIGLVLSDRIYFSAVKIPESNISIIIPLRSISIVISTIIGGLIFKEKNISRKMKYIVLLMLGIVLLYINS